MITGCWYCREAIAKGEEYAALLNGYGAHVSCLNQEAREEEQLRERTERAKKEAERVNRPA